MRNYHLLTYISAVLTLHSCSSIEQGKTAGSFQVISPFVGDTVYFNEYVAEINALRNVEIRTRVKGFVAAVHVDEGQTVRPSQTLFSIGSEEYVQDLVKATASLKSAIAELKSAEIELENTKKLYEKNILSKPELDLMLTKVEALAARVEEARSEESRANLNLSFTQVKAPFEGVINRIPNKAGSYVEEGAVLTTISSIRDVHAYFNVSEKEYLEYATSRKTDNSAEVALILANGSVYEHPGIIETTESEFDKRTGNIAFRARFPNPDHLLKHGSSGKVQLKRKITDALLIPRKSTFEIQQNTYVFVVDSDNTVHQRRITYSARLPQLYVVDSGLDAGDRIIYEGVQSIREGDQVIPEPLQFSQVYRP
jgi:RND family efflux transporter MFP subunit